MLEICPLNQAPDALNQCLYWCDREWGGQSGFAFEDWVAEFRRIESDPVDEVFVALADGAPVGMVWMLEREGLATHAHLSPWVSNLIVDPDHRDAGVARALLDHVESYLAAGGDTCAYLLAQTPGNYFTKGWEVLDTARLRNGHVFVMQKEFNSSRDVFAN